MDFSVRIEGLSELAGKFAQAPAIVAPILQRALSASGAILAKNTIKGVVPWRTGFLTQSFRAELTAGRLRWFPTASYAPYVELGHSQTPGRYVPAIGRRLVASSVKGNPFMERIISQSQGEIDTTFATALQQIVAALAA